MWLVDSDEFYLNKDIESTLSILKRNKPDQVNFPIHNFFKTPRYIMTSKGAKFKKLTRAVPRIFKNCKGIDFVSHWPPETARFPENIISGLRMKQKGIYIYHFGYMTLKQVLQKTSLYAKQHPDHKMMKEWHGTFWLKWKPSRRLKAGNFR